MILKFKGSFYSQDELFPVPYRPKIEPEKWIETVRQRIQEKAARRKINKASNTTPPTLSGRVGVEKGFLRFPSSSIGIHKGMESARQRAGNGLGDKNK